ncbi:MAG: hypothetical protein AB1766_11850 [Pseudomonadota bacterium]|jgi:hypothetical protein
MSSANAVVETQTVAEAAAPSSLVMTWAILSSEAALVLAVVLIITLVAGARRRGRWKQAASRLMEGHRRETPRWEEALDRHLKEQGIPLAEQSRDARRHRVDEFMRQLLDAWIRQEPEGVKSLADRLGEMRHEDALAVVEAVRAMTPATLQEAVAAVSGTVSDDARLREMESFNARLREELEATRGREIERSAQLREAISTINTLVGEYGRGRGREIAPTFEEILDIIEQRRGGVSVTPAAVASASSAPLVAAEVPQGVMDEPAALSDGRAEPMLDEAPLDEEALLKELGSASEPQVDDLDDLTDIDALLAANGPALTEPAPVVEDIIVATEEPQIEPTVPSSPVPAAVQNTTQNPVEDALDLDALLDIELGRQQEPAADEFDLSKEVSPRTGS